MFFFFQSGFPFFLFARHLQARGKLTGIRILLQFSSYKRLQSEFTFDKCRSGDLGGLPESSLAVSAAGLDVKLFLLPVARMLTLAGSGSSSPAWLISLCDGGASAEGADVVPNWDVGAGARAERKGGELFMSGENLKWRHDHKLNVYAEK